MSTESLRKDQGTWVLLSFIAFFGVIVAVNSVFITTALRTHSGVVTKQPYEKGLAYNKTLKVARDQARLNQEVSFNNGILQWVLKDEDGEPINADVTARLFRPVKDGQDFEVILIPISQGVYESYLNLPMKGRWDALLKAEWQTRQYQTRFSFIDK